MCYIVATMDIRHLRYFVAIAEEGSLSRAAERVHVAQPALSQHVRNMELDLKTELLFRTSRGVQLTEAGERLVAQARHLLEAFDALPDQVRGDSVAPSGEVRFGVPGTVSQVLSARLIKETAKRYPRIKLRVAEAMSGFILDWLREGKIDIAVLYRGIDGRGLKLSHVLSEELLLFGPADATLDDARPFRDPIDYARAIALPLVVPSPGHGLRDLLDEVAAVECGAALNADTEIDSYAPIKTLVESGYGFSILPAMAIKAECAAGRLRAWPLARPQIRRKVFVATASDRPLPAAAVAIEALCHDILRQLVIEGTWDASLAEAS
ncbi:MULTISPECIES: LysR family transcriptional regulator [unclassified Chelatococcus]|uniref:LysR family nitrogen assimilation transcriptional regulator n=2 Tax=Chelatococcus caeni TaxID=1348468 RepID=A0A840C1A1_9HYPH|nr:MULTISPECIES: LysR family transcriptional regulator [unclassified Chelatococcus]MBB4018990.1 LysR family nitrogen assimilation transcriptional regulator [Chelatococcus caeni]